MKRRKGEIGMKQKLKSNLRKVSVIIILTFLMTGCGNQGKSSYNTAMKEYNKGNYEDAAVAFEKAIRLKDDLAEYYIDYGFCLIQLNRFDEAETMFQKAILDKENKIVNRNNKKAYRGLGIAAYMQADHQKALELFEKAINIHSLNDYDMDIVSYMGSANLSLGNYEVAIENFTEAIAKNSKDLGLLLSRAKAYEKLGKYEECIQDYQAAKKLDAKNYEVYLGLYHAYASMEQMSEAANVLEEALGISPESAKDKFYVGRILYNQGKMDQAFSCFEEASQEGYVESYRYLGDIYSEKDDYENAKYYYEMYLKEANPQDGAFYNQLASVYLLLGDYNDALRMIEEGIKDTNLSVKQSLLRNEVIAYEHLGEYETAYTLMTSYLEIYPEDEDAVRDMEFLKTRQGQVSESEESTESIEIVKP